MNTDRTNGASPEAAAPAVRTRGLVKRYGRRGGEIVHALDDVTIDVAAGEFVVLLGPSGCGKTTLLRSIAGLETPDHGSIELLGREVFSSEGGVRVPAERRGISMMFQTYALWPHMTVHENVAYPLRTARVAKAEVRERVASLLARVGIAELAQQYPSDLSGGQQQRVALARTLARDPSLVLFDEPLSNVDAKVREQLRVELITMQRSMGFSTVYVTHDQGEAMALADRLVVMHHGRITQQGTPEEVYRRPSNLETAEFIGVANRLDGTVVEAGSDGAHAVETAAGTLRVVTDAGVRHDVGRRVHLIMRPEDMRLADAPEAGPNAWPMRLVTTMFSGSHLEHALQADGLDPMIVWGTDRHQRHADGELVHVSVEPGLVHLIPAEATP